MQKSPLSNLPFAVVISLALLILGHVLILQWTPDAPAGYLSIRGDSEAYVAMVEGRWSEAEAPLRYRILAPLIASALPLAPTESLRGLTYASLFLGYVFIVLSCSRLGMSSAASAIGLIAVWASASHVYNYMNPFLTDGLAFLMLCGMIYALVTDSFPLFAIFALLGVLTRETTIFLVPVWLVKDIRRTALLIMACVMILVAVRYSLPAVGNAPTLSSAFGGVGIPRLQQPLSFAASVLFTWPFVWFISLVGIWYLPAEKFLSLATGFIFLFLGALFTSLLATDMVRMFSILTPVLAIACAAFSNVLMQRRHRLLLLSMLVLCAVHFFVSIPNIFFGEGSWVFNRAIRYVIMLIGAAYSIFAFITLRPSVTQEARSKLLFLRGVRTSRFTHPG